MVLRTFTIQVRHQNVYELTKIILLLEFNKFYIII